jgi:hypothetical protein
MLQSLKSLTLPDKIVCRLVSLNVLFTQQEVEHDAEDRKMQDQDPI